jgi:hypothetical protein
MEVISGTTATLTINPTVTGDAASDYNVVITGTAPCTPLTSNNAALVVNQVVAITAQPLTTQTLCSGTATFSVSNWNRFKLPMEKSGTDLVNGGKIWCNFIYSLTITNVV